MRCSLIKLASSHVPKAESAINAAILRLPFERFMPIGFRVPSRVAILTKMQICEVKLLDGLNLQRCRRLDCNGRCFCWNHLGWVVFDEGCALRDCAQAYGLAGKLLGNLD